MQRCLGCMREFDEECNICPHCGYVVGAQARSKNHLAPGTVLQNRYTLGKVLGQGGFGITYIAWDNKLGRAVAIKEYMPNVFASRMTGEKEISCYNEEARQQFSLGLEKTRKEAHALSQFGSLESVVKVYDCIEENGTAYIIMDLLRGKTVKEILAERGKITLEETIRIMTPILQTLDAMHKKEMIHRDVAPDNIFVCEDDKIKLLDFGAARVVSSTDNKTLSVMLKAGYAPMEQYSGKAKQGPYTDIYAACATMYKMLTGITPESNPDRLAKDTLHPISDYLPIPEAIEKIIMKGMSIEARDRFQSAGELCEALQNAFQKEQGKLSAAASNPEQASGTDRLQKQTVKRICIALVSLIAIASVAVGIVFAVRSKNPPVENDMTVIDGSLKVGDAVTFGTYGIEGEQAQPIEWTVIDRSGDQLLLLSKIGLDYQTCHGESDRSFTWETSWIREWLNTDFYDAAFSAEEKDRIVMHENANPDDPVFGISGGNSTRDRCFLLSVQEVEKFFPAQEQRKAHCTDALFRREYKDYDLEDETIWWMLRSPGRNTSIAYENMCFSEVTPEGSFNYENDGLQSSVIRPAIWVDVRKNSAHAAEEWVSGYREHLYDFSWNFEDGVLTLSGSGVMPQVGLDEWDDAFCRSVKTVVIEKGFTTIACGEFMDFVNLTSVQIPEGIQEIGGLAFRNCPKLKTISFPPSVKRVGESVFHQSGVASNKDYWKNGLLCINHCLIRANKSLTGKVVIPNSITVIAENAFYDRPLTEVVVPEGITRLEQHVFAKCVELKKAILPDSILWIDGAFRDCKSLQTIRLPEQVQYIEYGSFYACESLQTIDLPQSIKHIGDQAFSCCWYLESVSMYAGIEQIESSAFFNTSLETVRFYGTEAEWNNIQIDPNNENLLNAKIEWATAPKSPFAQAAIGDTVKFGTFEQDGNTANGEEEIEWLIIDAVEDGNNLLLLSKYAIDCQQFNETYVPVTWEDCKIRKWLNNVFYKDHFTKEEQEWILLAQLDNPDNEGYGTIGGTQTKDHCFLLSLKEAKSINATILTVKPTKNAVQNGAFQNEETGNTWWMLRSPGSGNDLCAIVRSDGEIRAGGEKVTIAGAVRPAMWVSVS